MKPAFDLSLYLVLDPVLCGGEGGMIQTAIAAATGGATMIQLRDKNGGTDRMIRVALAIKAELAGRGVPLVVNDDVEAAIAAGADGFHIGQEDMAVEQARSRIGPDMLLGLSAETEVLAAGIDPALVDYAGLGPVFATATKPGHKPAVGMDGLGRLVAACRVPAVAIGGLKAEHAAAVLASGAKGMAVVSAICGTPDPVSATRNIGQALERARS